MPDLFSALASYFRKNTSVRLAWVMGSVIWLFITSVVWVLLAAAPVTLFDRTITLDVASPILFIPAVLALFIILIAGVSLSEPRPERGRSEFEKVFDMALMSLTGEQPVRRQAEPEDIIDAVKSNLGQLIEYYVINKGQAKSSFRASASAICVGFLTIILGVWLSYSGNLIDNSAVYLSVLAGVILQFVGGAYFYLYNRSLIQLNFFFTRLALLQDTLLAIRLTDSIPEGQEKHQVLEKVIFTILTRNAKVPAYLAPEPKIPSPPKTTTIKKPGAKLAAV